MHARAGHDRRRCPRPVDHVQLAHALLDELEAIVLVVNREVRRVADVPDVLAEDPHARRVEGRDQRRSDPDGRQQLLHPPRHLARGLVGERDGEDVPRMHTAHAEEPRDPVGDDARLAAAGAREHEDRPVVRRDGVALRRIQLGEERVAVQHQPIVP